MAIDYGSNNVTTSGNITVSGVVTATSGSFTNLLINGSSFNSSVSGLLPTIANSGDNRIITSNGTTTGLNAESNLVFDGTNLGIGTSSPSGKLDVRGNIYASGNVGINSPSPSSQLQIGTTIGSATNINTTEGYALGIHHSGLRITTPESATQNAVHESLNLLVSKPGSYHGGATAINFAVRDRANAFDFGTVASIVAGAKSGVTSVTSSQGGELYFGVAASGSTTPTTRMFINNQGFVGINTSTPSNQLHVVGTGLIGNLKIFGNTISSTSSNIIINPNSNGAIQRDSGGNNRGGYAIDFQSDRSSNSDVASGSYSVIINGRNNTASSYYSVVVGGYNNTCEASASFIGGGYNNSINSGSLYGKNIIGGGKYNTISLYTDYGFIGGGYDNTVSGYVGTIGGGWGNSTSENRATVCGGGSNTASGYASSVLGGTNNIASAQQSMVGGGGQNTASAIYSSVIGGLSNSATGIGSTVIGGLRGVSTLYGEVSHAAGYFAAGGDAQHSLYVLRNKTSGAVAGPTEMGLDGSSARLTIDSGKVLSGTINILGVKSDGATVARYLRQFTIKNVSGTTTLVSTATIGTDETNGTAISVTANNTSDYLSITTSGVNNQTWRWVATVDAIKMAYGL